MVQTVGHPGFLYMADCKASALVTRATIDHEGGSYLFPLPMTGDVPNLLREWVLNPPAKPVPLCLDDVTDEAGDPCLVGCGFIFEKERTAELKDGIHQTWTER